MKINLKTFFLIGAIFSTQCNAFSYIDMDNYSLNELSSYNFGLSSIAYTDVTTKISPLIGWEYQLYDPKTKFGLSLHGAEMTEGYLTFDIFDYSNYGIRFKSSLNYDFENQSEESSTITPALGILGTYNYNNNIKVNAGYDYRANDDYYISLYLSYRFGIKDKYSYTISSRTKSIIEYIEPEKTVKLTLKESSSETFNFDSFEVTDGVKNDIIKFIDGLDLNRISRVYVAGHTDSKGSKHYNWELSRKRAESVANLFIDNGIREDLINYYGLGESNPIGKDKDNRRVEILVKYKLNQ